MATRNQPPLELWGGVECTVNRVGQQFLRQLDCNGHRRRLSDLERFADLGLRTLRFPILWEELAPDSLESIAWSAVDAQLQKLRELGIKPIAGLVHHGSGPRYTSLLDPQFPEKLALFAGEVARRYPWIDAFTPVNEPLTTARFSGLYGHWYPHGRDGSTFARTLLNQCRGVVESMRAIREVTPPAALVQTEDLGKTFSSAHLRYQADFENERRWLTWDLLCGHVQPGHPMWEHLVWLGIPDRDLAFFQEHPCPPQIVGVNHYITSERFLDDDLRDYSPESFGGNGRDRYADVPAVRARAEGLFGPERLLREVWHRYHLPVAVTEAHLDCTREEQLRWLMEVWCAAQNLHREGLDVRAVTAWSLLGAFDWNSLLTRQDGYYESGAFDLRSDSPRPTAVATMLEQLARDGVFEHPTLALPGWWHRPIRLAGAAVLRLTAAGLARDESPLPSRSLDAAKTDHAQPILITGGAGRMARGFVRAAEVRGLEVRALMRNELNISDERAVSKALETLSPWAVINCAGFSGVDAAEDNEDACRHANVHGAEILARACARSDIPLMCFSSDYVFDGGKGEPYVESDRLEALNIYGESKIMAEEKVRNAFPAALIIRPGKVFAPFEASSLRDGLRAIARGERVRAASDILFSPTYLPDLVDAALDLLIDGEKAVWHLAHPDAALTPAEFLREAADQAQLDTGLIEGVPIWSLHRRALRPRTRALRSERGQLLPPLGSALGRYCHESPPLRAEVDRAVAVR
jgi:dTDP-4-dehydrorhamnose reductase